jgi:hypothetical protein
MLPRSAAAAAGLTDVRFPKHPRQNDGWFYDPAAASLPGGDAARIGRQRADEPGRR